MIKIELKNKYMMNYMLENLLKIFKKSNNIELFVIHKREKDFRILTPEIYIKLKEGTNKEILKLNLRLCLDFKDLCKTKILNKTESNKVKRLKHKY